MHSRGFPWTPIWESAVSLLALQRWARSHICSPWRRSHPVRLLFHLRCPLHRPERLWYFHRLLRLLKQQSCSRFCVPFQSWAEAVPASARGLFHTQPSIYQLSINCRLIKCFTSKSTIPLWWFAGTDSSGSLGLLSCHLFQLMALPVSQAEWNLCLESNWPGCRD